MSDTSTIRVVVFCPAPTLCEATGLLGWLTLEVGGLIQIDGVTLRRTRQDGRLYLAFPAARRDRNKPYEVVRPASQVAREHIERQVLEALERDGVAP